jgi:hypothetical protein
MKYLVLPNRTALKKKPSINKKRVCTKPSEAGTLEIKIDKDHDRVPKRYQCDYDNWFPWEWY